MRQCLDRRLLAVVCALAAGGWVCQSNVDNRCPGAVTCDLEVANVCCPLGSVDWCDGCSKSGCGTQTAYPCHDDARILDCSFNATIDSASCDSPASTSVGVQYSLALKGSLSGCGQEAALFVITPQDVEHPDVDCGDWDDGVFGGCVSSSPDTTTTHWTLTQNVPAGTTTVAIDRAHGSAPPLATMDIDCGGG